MVKNYFIPDRGDVVWIDFSPTRGREQKGLRPAVAISPFEYNSITGLAIVCPMTSKGKNYIFEVPVEGPDGQSFVLVDQIRTFDIKERIERNTGRLSMGEMNEILSKLSALLTQ